MRIYKVKVAEFEEIHKGDLSIKFIIDENTYKTSYCIKYGENYVDINTMQSYYGLKRDKDGSIANFELPDIMTYVPYGLHVEEMNYSDNCAKVNAILQLRALKAYMKVNSKEKRYVNNQKRLIKRINK